MAIDPGSASYEEITYATSDRIATITLNVPEKRNRLSYTLRREVVHALKAAESDDDVSLVLIRGAGPSFCSGYDLSGGARTRSDGEASGSTSFYRDTPDRPNGWIGSEHFDSWTDQFARSCLRDWITIWDLLKPVVAMVHGYCLAGGTELMSMCDIVFVADDASIGYPPMRGMTTPDVPYFPWKMTMAHAKYLQLTGNSVTGKEAAQMGWVAKSFPADELEERTMNEVRAMSRIHPALLSANKQQVNQAFEMMGMRTHLAQAWQFHVLSSQVRPGGGEFAQHMREGGLRAALAWRDGPFHEAGIQ